jgi:hypothetical protein
VVVARHQRRRNIAGHRVEQLPRRLDVRAPVGGAPAEAAQPAAAWRRLGGPPHTLERLLDRRCALQAHLPLRERPRGEMDVRVREAGQDTAAAEIDRLRRGERALVRPDAAGYAVARDCERAGRRQGRVERPDESVLEDHGPITWANVA